jgi:hypothetical protein
MSAAPTPIFVLHVAGRPVSVHDSLEDADLAAERHKFGRTSMLITSTDAPGLAAARREWMFDHDLEDWIERLR